MKKEYEGPADVQMCDGNCGTQIAVPSPDNAVSRYGYGEKCIEANPEIAADSRKQRQETLDFAYDDFLRICKEIAREESGRTWASAGIAFDRVKKLSGYAAIFQDRPIRLADLVAALCIEH